MKKYKQDKISILRFFTHIAVVLIVFVLPEVIFTNSGVHNKPPYTALIFLHSGFYVAIFYINYLFLINRFLFKRRPIVYAWVALAFIILMVFGMELTHYLTRPQGIPKAPFGPPEMHQVPFNAGMIARNFAMVILSMGISLAVKLCEYWINNEQQRSKAEAVQKQTELANLKNQLNPHFLFNTLNNIYALITIDKSKAQNAVHKLSKLLRYALYENSETVELSKDIEFISNFIELNKLRLNPSNILKTNIQQDISPELRIAPLLFISLIENAFKFGVNSSKPSEIDISIRINNKTVDCRVENTYFPDLVTDKKSSGIGLANLQRRLNILYENHHTLKYGIEGNKYISKLTINLK